jgi:hypothetical protein
MFVCVRKSAGESCVHILKIYLANGNVYIASDSVYRASGFVFTLFIRLHRVAFGRRGNFMSPLLCRCPTVILCSRRHFF